MVSAILLEEIAAGDVPRLPQTPGTATRIMTGAPMPEGADAVVQVELTEMVGDSVVCLQNVDVAPGKNMLPLGTSLRVGDTVLKKGARLRAIEIAVLAEIGREKVTAIPRPKLAVLPTGNELVPVGERPAAAVVAQRQAQHGRARRAFKARVAVRTANGIEPREQSFLKTHHGPIVYQAGGKSYALRVAQIEDLRALEQWYRMARARDLKQPPAVIVRIAPLVHRQQGNLPGLSQKHMRAAAHLHEEI